MSNPFKIVLLISILISFLTPSFAETPQTTGEKCFNAQTGQWTLKPDPSVPCEPFTMKSRSFKDPQSGLNLTIIDNFSFKDVTFEISVENNDFNGGLAWHYANKDNNYTAMINVPKRQVEIYKIIDGKRIGLAKAKLKLSDAPASFRIEQRKDKIQFFANNQLVVETSDSSMVAGKIGYWSKDGDATRIKYGNLI